ncbi:hypothetical protein QF026_003240 [Streptomyces aurantiacus]|uniref:hypothetical protein n=1 Tax=Streptomyces aurantiacus TaxID=47760 RepID=UPI00278DD782|nr:hypothetical protein [Streptomyces aurantiacus]MDQ0774774.1 hypothetical protein [Streptomyces aurantiacus]
MSERRSLTDPLHVHRNVRVPGGEQLCRWRDRDACPEADHRPPDALRGNTVHVMSAACLTAKGPDLLLVRVGR